MAVAQADWLKAPMLKAPVLKAPVLNEGTVAEDESAPSGWKGASGVSRGLGGFDFAHSPLCDHKVPVLAFWRRRLRKFWALTKKNKEARVLY